MITKVFRNLTAEDIRESVEEFEKAINQAQIIMFPGRLFRRRRTGRFREVLRDGLPERPHEGSSDEALK